jgi:hypothetical protein
VARLDMAYPSAQVGVEFDGEHHQNTPTFRADLAPPQSARRPVGLGNAMRRLGLYSSCAGRWWMIVGCCCYRSCTGSCVVCLV